jgi:AbrB family looped-hinge helix DNA binding protein
MPTEVGTVSTKGQVTVPRDIRRALRIRPGDKLLFDLQGGGRAIVQKAQPLRLTEILDRLEPSQETGVELQRRLRRDWSHRGH